MSYALTATEPDPRYETVEAFIAAATIVAAKRIRLDQRHVEPVRGVVRP